MSVNARVIFWSRPRRGKQQSVPHQPSLEKLLMEAIDTYGRWDLGSETSSRIKKAGNRSFPLQWNREASRLGDVGALRPLSRAHRPESRRGNCNGATALCRNRRQSLRARAPKRYGKIALAQLQKLHF
jgi:hypothetical protein